MRFIPSQNMNDVMRNDPGLALLRKKPERGAPSNGAKKPKRFSFKKILAVLLLLAAAGGGYGASYYYYGRYNALRKDPAAAAQKEVATLVAAIGQLIELPQDEQPTVATVLDREKLQEQSFFKRAENGDKLLVYVTAQKALLYRPSTAKLVEVGPIVMNATQEPSQTRQEPSQTGQQPDEGAPGETPASVRIAILNGTDENGLAQDAQKRLSETFANVDVFAKGNAARQDYGETLVVNLKNMEQEAQQIARVVGGTVGSLPDGEARPDTDILIILGKS